MCRFITGLNVIEAKNARLNGSSADVEQKKSGFDNVSYTKKIRRGYGNATRPYVSGQAQGYALTKFWENEGFKLTKQTRVGSNQVVGEGNPAKYIDEDLRGFLYATKITLTKEEYDNLTEEEQKQFSKKGKKYEKNITKKRKAPLQISTLQAISDTKIQTEHCTKKTDGDSILYAKEVYSAIMASGFNVDLDKLGRYTASEDEKGFRDYTEEEIKNLGVELQQLDEETYSLSNEERFKRLKTILEGMEFMSIRSCQVANLTDTSSKMVILGEYDWGNNIFLDVFNDKGIFDIEYFKETLRANEKFRQSNIYIGIKSGFNDYFKDGENKDLKERLVKELKDIEYVKISSVDEAVENFLADVKI